MTKRVICKYLAECTDSGEEKCLRCVNNTVRNERLSYFKEAKDNPIPAENPKLTYSGPAEQTAGYQCPVCGEFTNPYRLKKDHKCSACGWTLNINGGGAMYD